MTIGAIAALLTALFTVAASIIKLRANNQLKAASPESRAAQDTAAVDEINQDMAAGDLDKVRHDLS